MWHQLKIIGNIMQENMGKNPWLVYKSDTKDTLTEI